MKSKNHILVLDPIAFTGGSKIATENILQLLDTHRVRITLLSSDKHSWHRLQLNRIQLREPRWLSCQQQGVSYFLRHLFIALQVLLARLRYGRFDIALGASGPGVDLALYLLKPLLGFRLVQLIHGPVAQSRTIGRCLNAANENHYLVSTKDSLRTALATIPGTSPELEAPRFHVMGNGLPENNWPARCQNERPVIFWAASLLKWKGLDTLLDALKHIEINQRPETHICFIRPKNIRLPISKAPVKIESVHWHENPEHLDELRAAASIFVSTSKSEPFGLSILEAMSAGHCVLIPADGAYWDQILKDGIDCIKYKPDDAQDLALKLQTISHDMNFVRTLGSAAIKVTDNYRAETCYANIKKTLDGDPVSVDATGVPLSKTEITS